MEIINNDVVARHAWHAKYKRDLAEISNDDYPRKQYFAPGILALDIDSYEADTTGANDRTVDAAIGKCCYDGRKKSNPHLSLVELRMNYRSAKNLHHSALSAKVAHTKALLGHAAVGHPVFFVFTDKVAPQAVSEFAAWQREKKDCADDWVAIGVSDYNNTLKTEGDFNYQTPRADDIGNGFAAAAANAYDLADWLDYWNNEICRHLDTYDLLEAKAVHKAVKHLVDGICLETIEDAGERGYLQIVLDDFARTTLSVAAL